MLKNIILCYSYFIWERINLLIKQKLPAVRLNLFYKRNIAFPIPFAADLLSAAGKKIVKKGEDIIMYERMLDKKQIPSEGSIETYIGKRAVEHIKMIQTELEKLFELNMELKFPFGNNYGWGYKVSNKSKH